MDYTCGYGYEDDYLNEDDNGLMCCTKDNSSDSDDDQNGDSISSLLTKHLHKKASSKFCQENDSEDEFEKEMSVELSQTMQNLTRPLFGGESSKPKALKPKEEKKEFYDNIYFDTDESDEELVTASSTSKIKNKRRIQTNDDLLYDPNMDEDDQEWIDWRRRSYQMKKSFKGNGMKPLPQSDAVLNCPACFTTLCLDCQRHDIYKDQYRAMFVFNCVIDNEEILHFTKKQNKNKLKKTVKFTEEDKNVSDSDSKICQISNTEISVSAVDEGVSPILNNTESMGTSIMKVPNNEQIDSSKKKSVSITESEMSEELAVKKLTLQNEDDFYPVKCSVCNTKVAVQDKEEIYHFFNVITSY